MSRRDELLADAEQVADGWYPPGTRIDWDDLLDRVEKRTGHDLGTDMGSQEINAIKAHVRRYRRCQDR